MYQRLQVNDLPPSLKTAARSLSKKRSAVVSSATSVALATGWDSGSRSSFSSVNLASGSIERLVGNSESAWFASKRTTPEHAIDPGFAVVDCGTFQGKTASPHFFLHPEDFARMFPAPAPIEGSGTL